MVLSIPGICCFSSVRSVILRSFIVLTFIFQVLLLVLNLLRSLFGAPGVGPWPVTLLQLPVGYPKRSHTQVHIHLHTLKNTCK